VLHLTILASAMPEISLGPQKSKSGHVNLTMPIFKVICHPLAGTWHCLPVYKIWRCNL